MDSLFLLSNVKVGTMRSIWKTEVRNAKMLIFILTLCCLCQDWKTTNLDGSILDYLAKLVADKKIDPVMKSRWFTASAHEYKCLFAGGREDIYLGPG